MTEQVARDGMVLDADGLDTSAFEQNPVVLWSHGTDPRRGDEPIAKAHNLRRNGEGMLADVTFADDEFAQRIREKVRNGFVNAVSIGWRTEDIDRTGDAPTVTEADMTEFSFVAVPADSQALVQERTAGSEVEHRIGRLEEKIEQLRAEATATSPQPESDMEGTPSASDDASRDAAQEGDRRSADAEQYVPLSALKKLKAQQGRQWTREDIRTELKKILGMA
jgi:HK97 family phage prohead protease